MTETATNASASPGASADSLGVNAEAVGTTILTGADDSVSTEQGAKTGDSGADKAAADNGAEAPAGYADFIVPEGVALDPELTGEFKEAALKAGLKQEQAQQLIELGVKLQNKILNSQQAAVETQKAAWLDAVKSDREIGGDKLPENLAIAARAVNAFVSPALKELFDKTGLGNHPDIIRAFMKAGKLISEDTLAPGGTQPAGGGKTMAERLYPNQN